MEKIYGLSEQARLEDEISANATGVRGRFMGIYDRKYALVLNAYELEIVLAGLINMKEPLEKIEDQEGEKMRHFRETATRKAVTLSKMSRGHEVVSGHKGVAE